MCVCEYVSLCDFTLKDLNEHVLAREITNNGVKKKYQEKKIFKKNFVTMWERTANKYCWSGPVVFSAGVVLVHKCLFNHPFFSSRGWGLRAEEVWPLHHRKEGKRIEYFVIVQSEGDSLYISILYICDENAFCVTLPFTCTMVQHSVFQCC